MISPDAPSHPENRGGRVGAGIREFLEYYLLVILNEGESTKQKMKELMLERSAGNNKFRQGSALLVADGEINEVIKKLFKLERIKTTDNSNTFEITDEGKKALEKSSKIKEQTHGSKEEATQKLISLLDPFPPKKYVLDVGTGEGYLAFKLAESGFKVMGIDSSDYDYSKDCIQKAVEKLDNQSDIEFRVADVRNLSKMKDTFDYVVSSQAVHCMRNQSGCIEAIYSLLKKGGKFVCSDLSIGLLGFLHHGFHSFLALSEEEWFEILPKCGYINVKVHNVKDFCVAEGQKTFSDTQNSRDN
jgi:ubiquinone/menaquinone biosynthesis C-methylase UbiE